MDITVYYTISDEMENSTTTEAFETYVSANSSQFKSDPFPVRAEDDSDESYLDRFHTWLSDNPDVVRLVGGSELVSEDTTIDSVE